MSDEARDVDLLALSDDVDEIAAGDVPAGRLTQIRLILAADAQATLVVDGAERDVLVPSAVETGLKLFLAPPIALAAGEAVAVALRLDGVVETGEGGLVLQPVLALEGASPDATTASDRP